MFRRAVPRPVFHVFLASRMVRTGSGTTTRSGDSLESFQDTILARPALANLGIMKPLAPAA